MSTVRKVAVIIGSLREESLSRKTGLMLGRLAPLGLRLEIVEIGDLPLYNEDLEAAGVAAWQRFRTQIRGADAVLFVTPEYNRSLPASIKNAIDVGSRPYGESIWDGKPGAVVSVSLGAIGGFGANHHLRQSLVCLNVPVMQQPEAYIANAGKLFDRNGDLTNQATATFLGQFMQAFSVWTDRNLSVEPRQDDELQRQAADHRKDFLVGRVPSALYASAV
jgi:chromate reductase, NAD(P)H dehydrogenase (quinone)